MTTRAAWRSAKCCWSATATGYPPQPTRLTARNRFREFAPECVILDLRLPSPEDGLALVREFREFPAAAPGLRIVVLAGWSADLEGHPEQNLVDEVLAKPVRSERLMGAVRKRA